MVEADAADSSQGRDPRLVRTLRASTFLVLLAAMLAGPICQQVLEMRVGYLRGWTMFSGRGLGDMDVNFYQVLDGERRALAWGAMLRDDDRKAKRRREVRHGRDPLSRVILSNRDIGRVARDLCKKLPPGAELHADTRTARKRGWSRVRVFDVDLCSTKGRKALREKPTRRKGARRR